MATPPLHINDIKMLCMYCAGHTVPFNNVIPLWTRRDRKWAGGSLRLDDQSKAVAAD